MRVQAGYDGVQGLRIAPLGRHSPEFEQCGWIVWLCGENLLQQLLEFSLSVGIALALHFLGQQVHGAQVTRVDLDGFAEFGDGLGGIASFAFEHTGQIMKLVVLRRQLLRLSQAFGCRIEVSLT